MSPQLVDLTAHARSLTVAGDLSGARTVLAEALAPADVDPTRASPELAEAAALHARILITLGEPGAARTWADFAQAAQQRLHGPHDERTLAAAATHAAVLHRVGNSSGAARLYSGIVMQLSARDGPDSARVLAAEADLATAEHAGGHCVTARRRLTDVWRRHQAAFGDASLPGMKMLARLGAMERECGLAVMAQEHLRLAQELCARYLPGDHALTVQIGALSRAPASGAHVCRARSTADAGHPPTENATGAAVPSSPGVTRVGTTGVIPVVPHERDAGASASGATPATSGDRASGWPPDGDLDDRPGDGLRFAMDVGPLTSDPADDRLLPVPVPVPPAPSRRPVVVAGVVSVGLVVTAAAVTTMLSSDDAGAGADRAATSPQPRVAASGPAPPIVQGRPEGGPALSGTAATDAPPGDLVLQDDKGRVTLRWRYPNGAEGPVLLSGGRADQEQRVFQQLAAGSDSYLVYGLNERADYCFTVSVVYSVDSVASSPQVCTDRG